MVTGNAWKNFTDTAGAGTIPGGNGTDGWGQRANTVEYNGRNYNGDPTMKVNGAGDLVRFNAMNGTWTKATPIPDQKPAEARYGSAETTYNLYSLKKKYPDAENGTLARYKGNYYIFKDGSWMPYAAFTGSATGIV